MTAVGICRAVDLLEWGPDARELEPGEPAGVACELVIHANPEGVLSIDISGGRAADRRILVNTENLRSALAEAGIQWAERSRT